MIAEIGDWDSLPQYYEGLKEEDVGRVKAYYEAELMRRQKIEEKARANLSSITLSVTLIGSAAALAVPGKSLHDVFGLSVLFFVLGIAYLLSAGACALSACDIGEYNTLTLSVELRDRDCPQDLMFTLIQYTELNQLRTTIRSNYASASFRAIQNGIICVGLACTLMFVPRLISLHGSDTPSGALDAKITSGLASTSAVYAVPSTPSLLRPLSLLGRSNSTQSLVDWKSALQLRRSSLSPIEVAYLYALGTSTGDTEAIRSAIRGDILLEHSELVSRVVDEFQVYHVADTVGVHERRFVLQFQISPGRTRSPLRVTQMVVLAVSRRDGRWEIGKVIAVP